MTKVSQVLNPDDRGRIWIDVGEGQGAAWSITRVDWQRYLLSPLEQADAMGSMGAGMMRLPGDLWGGFLKSLATSGFSGCLTIDTGQGVKKLYFFEGAYVYGASALMDDRLGEICYRQKLITLDQLVDAAGRVSKEMKFGQVLVAQGILSATQLFEALQIQMEAIFSSTFFCDWLYLHIDSEQQPSGYISMACHTLEFIQKATDLGGRFRDFHQRLAFDEPVEWLAAVEPVPGTYEADMCALLSQCETIEYFIQQSKLGELNSLYTLFCLEVAGQIEVPYKSHHKVEIFSDDAMTYIDKYNAMHQAAEKVALQHGRPIDFSGVASSYLALVKNRERVLEVFESGAIALKADQVTVGASHGSGSYHQAVRHQVRVVVSLMLQFAGDQLPRQDRIGLVGVAYGNGFGFLGMRGGY